MYVYLYMMIGLRLWWIYVVYNFRSPWWVTGIASALLGEWQLFRAALGTGRALTEVNMERSLIMGRILITNLGGGFKDFFFNPYLGKWSNLTNIFQRGWNHQLVTWDEGNQHCCTRLHNLICVYWHKREDWKCSESHHESLKESVKVGLLMKIMILLAVVIRQDYRSNMRFNMIWTDWPVGCLDIRKTRVSPSIFASNPTSNICTLNPQLGGCINIVYI